MTTNFSGNLKPRGMTLLELTVVILVLLSMISILFIGARAWKEVSDKSACVMNIRNVQQMIRSYQNLNNHTEGTTINVFVIANDFGVSNIGTCPGGGDYDHVSAIPPVGTLAMTCSLASSLGHEPINHNGW